MATTITNGNIDTAAAAVAAPWGPLTRVTDVANLPTPNSEITLELTAATGTTYYMTYEQLTDADVRLALIEMFEGINFKVETLKTKITALDAAADAMTLPHTEANYKTLIDLLRGIEEIKGYY